MKDIRKDIIEGIKSEWSIEQIAEALDMTYANVNYYLKQMMKEGLIERTGRGVYAEVSKPAKPSANGHSKPQTAIGHANSRKVALPEYMKSRPSVTVFVEHSPQEIEGVMRLEIEIQKNWLPIPTNQDLRVCVGDDVPRWSATQEVYQNVSAFRVTLRNGDQFEYAHNPNIPVTVDMKS